MNQEETPHYQLYLNGKFYGSSIGHHASSYMTELFRDYVEHNEMYGKEKVTIEVIKKR